MSDCKSYVSKEDLQALKESQQHIEHVARSRNAAGEKALQVTDSIRGENVTNRTLDGLEELYNQALSNIGYQQVGDYAPGLNITDRAQVVFYDGSWYIYRGELPHVTAGATLPEDGGIWSQDNPNGLWVNVGNNIMMAGDGDKHVNSSFGGTVYSDYSRTTIVRKASFEKGGVLESKYDAVLFSDGFFYVYKGSLPFTVNPGSSPDNNFICCGNLSGYELYNFKNFKNSNSDNDALEKCLAFNNRALIDADTTIYLMPFVITKPVHITINGSVYAHPDCPDLTVLISSDGVSDIRIDGVGKIDGNESVVTSSKMRLIHLIGGIRQTIENITLTNNFISEDNYGAYSDSTIWIDGGYEHRISGVKLINYGLEGISVTAERSILTDIIGSSNWGEEGGTRCLNYSLLHTLGSKFIVTNITSYNTGASAVGIDSTESIVSNINIDKVRFSNGVGLGHPNKPADGTIVSNVVVKNLLHPAGANRAGVSVGDGSKNIKLNNITVVNSTNQGINVSAGATNVDITNFFADNCDTAFSMFNATCMIDGMRLKNCKYGISKQRADDKIMLNNVNLSGATTKLLGSEDNFSGNNVIFDETYPRQAVVQISNVSRPVTVTNPNIRPWSTISLISMSANTASALPFIQATKYGSMTINSVNAPTHYAGVKYYLS